MKKELILSAAVKQIDPLLSDITDGENGYLFNDAEGLISAVDRLFSNQSMLESFSEKSIESAQRFSVDTFVRSVTSVYTELKEDYAVYLLPILLGKLMSGKDICEQSSGKRWRTNRGRYFV